MFKGKKSAMVFNKMGGANPVEGLRLKWNQHDIYQVENLINIEVTTYEQILYLFHFGIKNKVIGSHKMNFTSSRSHTIFCMSLEQVSPRNPDNTIISKL